MSFPEVPADWGRGGPRGWCRGTVLGAAPCRLGLDRGVARFDALRPAAGKVSGVGQEAMSFSDAIPAVRRWLGTAWVLAPGGHPEALAKLSDEPREAIIDALALAA